MNPTEGEPGALGFPGIQQPPGRNEPTEPSLDAWPRDCFSIGKEEADVGALSQRVWGPAQRV